jgi:hypothetical protein
VKKLSLAAAALAAATFVPASAFVLTGSAHPSALASSGVVKVADVYRPARHYRSHRVCCGIPVYYACGVFGCGCRTGWGWGYGCGGGWGWGWPRW